MGCCQGAIRIIKAAATTYIKMNKKREEKNPFSLIVVFCAVIAVSILFSTGQEMMETSLTAQLADPPQATDEPVLEGDPAEEDPDTDAQEILQIRDGDHVLGSFHAPRTLVFFANFNCLSCGKIFQDILSGYVTRGSIRIVWRHFPESEEDMLLAVKGECAGEQGRFWEYASLAFEGWPETGSMGPTEIIDALGLDPEEFHQCLELTRHSEKIEKNLESALSFGILNAPEFFLDGNRLPITDAKNLILPSF